MIHLRGYWQTTVQVEYRNIQGGLCSEETVLHDLKNLTLQVRFFCYNELATTNLLEQ